MHAGKRVQLRVIAAAIPPVVLTAAYCFVLAEDDVQAFGVYGLLSLGRVLIVERLLTPGLVGKEKWLGRSSGR